MNNFNRTENYAGNVIILIAGILTSAIGLLAMLGWILQLPLLASFSANHIPMAPSTALLFILIGMALSIRSRLPQYRVTYIFGLLIGLLVALSGLIFFISSLAKKNMIIEHLGFAITDTINGIQTGHMSLVTAISFVACALAFLLTLSQSVEKSKRAWIAMVLALTLILKWLIFLFAYLSVIPLMYSGGIIPPSLSTSLTFLFVAIGLLTSALHQTGLYNKIKNATGTRVSYIFLLIFILLTFGIVGSGYFAFRRYEKNFRREIEQQLTAVAELKVNQLLQWRKERLDDAKVFHKNNAFSDLVKRYLKTPSNADAKMKIQAWLRQIAASGTYDRISLFDIAGTELISFPQTIIHPPYHFSVNIAEVLKSGNVKFQDFYRDDDDKKVYLAIFVPVLDEYNDKKLLSVIVLRIDPAQYLYPMIEKWPSPSKTAETLIIRKDGNDALFLNDLRFRKDVVLNLRVPITNKKMPAVKATLGQIGIVDGIDYRGVPVIADVRAVPDSPWFLVARIDSEEVYAPMTERLWMIISFIVILIIMTGASIGFLWQQQYKRFYREQETSAEALKINQSTLAAAEQLGKVGGWEFDIDTKALKWSDEVCRIHEVDITFKPTIEAGINFYAPASRLVVEHAVQRAIEQGEPFDVELQIITAKNNLRWVHSIGNTDQEHRKVFGFFQDITDRKLAEDKVQESHVKLNTLLELSNQSRQTLLSVLEDQTKAIEDLHVSEERLRLATEQSNVAVWENDFNSNSMLRSQNHDTLYGLEWQSKWDINTFLNATHPEDREYSNNFIQNSVAPGGPDNYSFDFRVVFPDNSIRWLTTNGRVIERNKSGQGIRVRGTLTDITEQKNAELALRESEERFSTVFDKSAFVAALSSLTDGVLIAVNKAFMSVFGYEREEALGQTTLTLGINPDADGRARVLDELKKNGSVRNLELRLHTKSGEEKFFAVNIDVIEIGGQKYLLNTMQDITERKNAELDLIQMARLLKNSQEIAHLGSFEYVVADQTTIWSEEEYRLYGLDPNGPSPEYNEMLEKCIHPDDAKMLHDTFISAMQSQVVYELEHRIVRPDGSVRWVYDKAHPYFDEHGNLLRYVGATLDTTDRKRLQDELEILNTELEKKVEQRTAQLKAANKELETFTYSVSHDLKAPLRGIDGYSKLLVDTYKTGLNEEAQSFIEKIRSSTLQMNQLIDDLLDYSRLERSQLSLERIKIKNLIKSVVSIYNADLEAGNFKKNMNITDIELIADPKGLTIALRNLLENAIKFTRGNANPLIQIEVEEKDLSWIISVNDNGIGFDMQYHQKIFEIFQRLQRVEDFPGTGIGLAMVNKAMQRMHGRVWAESIPGVGSTFYLEIPKNQ